MTPCSALRSGYNFHHHLVNCPFFEMAILKIKLIRIVRACEKISSVAFRPNSGVRCVASPQRIDGYASSARLAITPNSPRTARSEILSQALSPSFPVGFLLRRKKALDLENGNWGQNMRQLEQKQATSTYSKRIAILMFCGLSMNALPHLSGCALDYSMNKTRGHGTATDTDTASGSASHSESDSTTTPPTVDDTATQPDTESTTIPCPTALVFEPTVTFTDKVVCDKPAQEYTDSCPEGQAIVGFSGLLRDYDLVHARIRAICGIPSVKQVGNDCVVEVAPGELLPVRGTSGSIDWSRMCPENQFLMGFKVWTGDNLDKTIFRCAPLLITREGSQFSVTRGPFTDLEFVGKDAGHNNPQADCPADQIATTTYIQADTAPRALGLGCRSPSLQ